MGTAALFRPHVERAVNGFAQNRVRGRTRALTGRVCASPELEFLGRAGHTFFDGLTRVAHGL